MELTTEYNLSAAETKGLNISLKNVCVHVSECLFSPKPGKESSDTFYKKKHTLKFHVEKDLHVFIVLP